MSARHRPVSSSRTTEGDREVVRVWCECGHPVIAPAVTVGEAWRKARQARNDHRGNAALARGGETS